MFNVEADPQGAGYQVIQSQVAIGSGGLTGKGIGGGTQTHLKFLPEQHTDFIFSVLGEEHGFIGVVVVLLLYLLLILFSFQTAYKLKDKFSSLVVVGLTSILFFHIAINVAMIVGLMPVTGLPLPFLSYGGTFLLTCSIIISLILNMSVIKTRY
jgi:rod shape determining protein RodA